jgi:subtilisin family serine protease
VDRRDARLRRQALGVLLRCALIVAALACLIASPAAAVSRPETLLVKLRADAVADAALALSGHPVRRLSPLGVPGWFRVTVDESAAAQVLLQRDPDVLIVQRDRPVHAVLVPNDPYWSSQWGPAQIHAPGAWDVTTGQADVVVAVIDTGADMDHSDLVGQFWVNADEVPGNGVDDDANGKIDDIHGWRFGRDADGNPYGSGNLDDDHGHGTHVAGIVAAAGNNALGIAGIAWGCRLMIVKVLDANGDGLESDVASALVYALDNGAKVANLSLGGDVDSPLLRDAADYVSGHGVLVVAAAGNNNGAVLYPAAYEPVLAVAASDASDGRAPYSSHGPEVDLTAPGSGVYSTCVGNRYCVKTGTSMAAPHVSGLAALIWSRYPGYAVAQVRQTLIDSAQDIGTPGWDEYTGWGRIDAQRAISENGLPRTFYVPYVVQCMACEWPWSPGP